MAQDVLECGVRRGAGEHAGATRVVRIILSTTLRGREREERWGRKGGHTCRPFALRSFFLRITPSARGLLASVPLSYLFFSVFSPLFSPFNWDTRSVALRSSDERHSEWHEMKQHSRRETSRLRFKAFSSIRLFSLARARHFLPP